MTAWGEIHRFLGVLWDPWYSGDGLFYLCWAIIIGMPLTLARVRRMLEGLPRILVTVAVYACLALWLSVMAFERAGTWSLENNFDRFSYEAGKAKTARTEKELLGFGLSYSEIERKDRQIILRYAYRGVAAHLCKAQLGKVIIKLDARGKTVSVVSDFGHDS